MKKKNIVRQITLLKNKYKAGAEAMFETFFYKKSILEELNVRPPKL